MSWQFSATGSIEQTLVDQGRVEDVLHAEGNLNQFRSWAAFFGGAALSTAPMLATKVDHPIPIYMTLVGEAALAIAGLVLSFREQGRVDRARDAMTNSGIHFNAQISTPPVSWGATTEAPSTGTIPSTGEVTTSDQEWNHADNV